MASKTIKASTAKQHSRTRPARAKKAKVARSGSVRLEMCLERRAKDLIERAAALTGRSITDFAVSNPVESALETIERHEQRLLLGPGSGPVPGGAGSTGKAASFAGKSGAAARRGAQRKVGPARPFRRCEQQ
jgi:hypothetical protein